MEVIVSYNLGHSWKPIVPLHAQAQPLLYSHTWEKAGKSVIEEGVLVSILWLNLELIHTTQC